MAELGSKIGSAYFEVLASTIGFGDSLEAGVTNAITARSAVLGDAMEKLGKALFTRFTIPLAVAAAANLAQFTALERSVAETLTLFNTAPTLIDKTFGEMTKGIRDVSEAVGGLERDIADGLYQTISAGVPRGDAFEFLEVAQIAATADKTADLTGAVDGLTTGLNAFGLSADQASRVSDVLFAGVAKGKTTFGELANDIGRVFPLAAAAGGTLEETTAIIAQLTAQGLKTSESVSFLRAAITGLIRPGEEMNEIFERLGFSSAETAIPVLGLQGAFEAVVTAAGGSTSKLQELIGTSEGVLAILGVTGDNAEKFAGTLDFITNSAGLTKQAFEIIEGTVSRSFGRMTEAFDRLGNLFGGMAAQFAQPVVDTITSIVSGVVNVFEGLIPVAVNVGEAFGFFLGVLDLPLIKGVAVGLASIALSIGAILGVAAPLIFTVGKILKAFVSIAVFRGLWKILGSGVISFRKGVIGAGQSMVVFSKAMEANNVATKSAAGSIRFFGTAISTTVGQIALSLVAIAAVTAVIGLAIIAWSKWRDGQKLAFEAIAINTVGVDQLSESLGIAGKQIALVGELFAVDAKEGAEAFKAENFVLINQIDEIASRFGDLAGRDLILSIGSQLQIEGATPEEAFDAVQRLGNATNITIGLSFEDFSADGLVLENVFKGAEASVLLINEEIKKFGDLGAKGLVGKAPAQLANLADGLSEALILAINLGQTDAFFDLAENSLAGLENTKAMDFLFDEMVKSIEDITGTKLGVDLSSVTDLETFITALEDAGFTYSELQRLADAGAPTLNVEVPDAPKDLTGGLPSDIEQFGIQIPKVIEGVVQLTSDQIGILQDLKREIGSVLTAGEDFIQQAFDSIQENILNQTPLIQGYGGAVKVVFSEWKTGMKQFQEDIAGVTELRGELVDRTDLDSRLLEAFDTAPITDKVWLTKLGANQLDEALELMAGNLEAADLAVGVQFEQDIDAIMVGANAAMKVRTDELIAAAGVAGTGVTELFLINLAAGVKLWEDTASTAMANIRSTISQTIAGPVIGPVTFTEGGFGLGDAPGLSRGDTYNFNINNPTGEPTEDSVQRGLAMTSTVSSIKKAFPE